MRHSQALRATIDGEPTFRENANRKNRPVPSKHIKPSSSNADGQPNQNFSHAELEELREGCHEFLRRINAALNRAQRPVIPEDLIDLATAARQVKKTKETLRRWCRRYQIGIVAGGRWMVSMQALRAMHRS